MNRAEYYVVIAITEKDMLSYSKVLGVLEREGYRLRYFGQTDVNVSDLAFRVYMPMVTMDFLLNQGLMDNLKYLLSKNKVVVPIILEDIILPAELEMAIFSHLQSVMYFQFNDTSVLIEQLQYVYELDLCKDLKKIPRGFGRISYGDTCFYEGELIGEIRDGKGYMHWADGYEYDGEWENDVCTGKGSLNWNRKKYHGKGEYNEFIYGR